MTQRGNPGGPAGAGRSRWAALRGVLWPSVAQAPTQGPGAAFAGRPRCVQGGRYLPGSGE